MKNEKLFTHIWSIICSSSLLDKNSNNLSLINTIERLSFGVKEADAKKIKKDGAEGIIFPINFEVVSRFVRKEIRGAIAFDYRITILNPEGKAVVNSERKIGIDKSIKSIRVVTNFQSLPVNVSGDYLVVIEFKDVGEERYSRVAELPLEVVVNTIPDQASK